MLGQTDGRTDTVPFHRACSARYAGKANKAKQYVVTSTPQPTNNRRVNKLRQPITMMDKTPLSLAVHLGLEATPINFTNDIARAMFELRTLRIVL